MNQKKTRAVSEIQVKYLEGIQFVAESSSGKVVFVDGGIDGNGNNTGIRPTDLLLMSLGSCAGMGIVSILKKKKQDVRGFNVIIRGENEHEWPKRVTNINIEFVIEGNNLSEDAVNRAIELSMGKYCTVKATLENPAQITATHKILATKKISLVKP